MKRIILITCTTLLLAGCRSAKPIVIHTETSRYDSLYSLLSDLRTNYSRMESEKTAIIDTLRNMALPVESSANVLPVSVQRSELETSLAKSAAWMDSLGLLHHTLKNKANAKLPSRTETTDRTKETDKATSSTATSTTKVTEGKNSTEKTEVPVYVPVERFGGKFFYLSGWVLWIGFILAAVWYMQTRTKIKPITRIINLITKTPNISHLIHVIWV